jgi:hypothetical protein
LREVRSSILIDGEAPKICRLRYRKVLKSVKGLGYCDRDWGIAGIRVLLKSRVDQSAPREAVKALTSSEESLLRHNQRRFNTSYGIILD